MVRSYSRGLEIYLDGDVWRYLDTNEVWDNSRPCKKCVNIQQKKGMMRV